METPSAIIAIVAATSRETVLKLLEKAIDVSVEEAIGEVNLRVFLGPGVERDGEIGLGEMIEEEIEIEGTGVDEMLIEEKEVDAIEGVQRVLVDVDLIEDIKKNVDQEEDKLVEVTQGRKVEVVRIKESVENPQVKVNKAVRQKKANMQKKLNQSEQNIVLADHALKNLVKKMKRKKKKFVLNLVLNLQQIENNKVNLVVSQTIRILLKSKKIVYCAKMPTQKPRPNKLSLHNKTQNQN